MKLLTNFALIFTILASTHAAVVTLYDVKSDSAEEPDTIGSIVAASVLGVGKDGYTTYAAEKFWTETVGISVLGNGQLTTITATPTTTFTFEENASGARWSRDGNTETGSCTFNADGTGNCVDVIIAEVQGQQTTAITTEFAGKVVPVYTLTSAPDPTQTSGGFSNAIGMDRKAAVALVLGYWLLC